MKKQLILLLLILSTMSFAKDWSFTFLVGIPYNFPTDLLIKQDGEDDIKIDSAKYSSKPFEIPIYYNYKFGKTINGKKWELGIIHHKLYLENKHNDIQHFEITHGYNIITLKRVFEINDFQYRIGSGIIYANPEVEVRNRLIFEEGGVFGTGYQITYPVLELGIGKEYELFDKILMDMEINLTLANPTVKIKDGEAKVPNIAFHGNLGPKVTF